MVMLSWVCFWDGMVDGCVCVCVGCVEMMTCTYCE